MPNQHTSVWNTKGLYEFCKSLAESGMKNSDIAIQAARKFKVNVTGHSVTNKMQGIIRGVKTLKDEDLPIEKRIENDQKEFRLRAENDDLRKKYETVLETKDIHEKIAEMARKAIRALPTVKPPKVHAKGQYATTESAVLMGSCWHIGEVIDKEEMGGLNEYDFNIFVRRFQWLVEKTISFTQENMASHRFEELHVFLTGDMVSGIIHDELIETNEMNIVDQAFLGALVTAQGLLDLARAFPRVIVTGVVGNHGRVTQEKKFKGKATASWDRVFYETLAMLLKNQENIEFNLPRSYWAQIEVQGHIFQVQHGDTVKGSMGIPFYGLKREMNKWVEINAIQNRIVKYFCMSHYHTTARLQTGVGEMIMNGSLKGGDEYAIGLGLYSDPVQLLFGVHPKYGKSWELSINAKDPTLSEVRYNYDTRKNLVDQLDVFR